MPTWLVALGFQAKGLQLILFFFFFCLHGMNFLERFCFLHTFGSLLFKEMEWIKLSPIAPDP